MNIVVGSGPSGVAAAVALLNRGVSVLMIDGGETLENEVAEKIEALAKKRDSSRDSFAFIKKGYSPDSSGIAEKYNFGSDFPFRTIKEQFKPVMTGMGNIKPSLATGGFSTVWGAACTAFYENDIVDWPLDRAELEPHYRAVAELIGITGDHDDLDQVFKMSHFNRPPISLGKGLQNTFANLTSKRSALGKKGFFFGRSRIALDTIKCKNCGLCMYGCPWNLIYSTQSTLKTLKSNPLFTHRPGLVAKQFVENNENVDVHCYNRHSKSYERITGQNVFVGCGALETTAIVMNSLKLFDIPIKILTSEYFLLPYLSLKAGAMSVLQVTLSQLFFEIQNSKISKYLIHMQAYDYNELFQEALTNMLGRGYRLFKPFEKLLLSRLFVAQGYLHSDDSSCIEASLSQQGVFSLVGIRRADTSYTIRRLKGYLWKIGLMTSFIPLLPLFKRGMPGDGRHIGGSFPMRKNPGALESDLLGRVGNLKKVYLIDASIFPSIPATTITFTIMANAYRIAAQAEVD